MFIENGFQYFHHNAKFLFHKMPSALAKILGAYKIKIKHHKTNKLDNIYIILMENLFYGKSENETKLNLKIKLIATRFIKSTTIHGLPNVFQNKRVSLRLVWLLFTIVDSLLSTQGFSRSINII